MWTGRGLQGVGPCWDTCRRRPPRPRSTAASPGRSSPGSTARSGCSPGCGTAWNGPCGGREELTIRTWHQGGQAATLYRDYDLYVGREPVGECVSAWVLARQSDRQLLRLSAIRELDNTGGGALCKDKKLSKLRLPDGLREADRRRTRYSDTDINGHVNNTRYADSRLRRPGDGEAGGGDLPLPAQIGYLAECRPGRSCA